MERDNGRKEGAVGRKEREEVGRERRGKWSHGSNTL